MSTDEQPKLVDQLEKVYVDNATRLREIGGKEHRQDAADVVHEAFVKTLDAGSKQTIRDPVRFVFKVTRNVVLNRLRERIRRVVRPFHEDEELADVSPGTEQAALASERLQRAMEIINRMPERRREAFLQHRIDELSYPEIARRMGISIKAVEKHISAAMVQLHEEIDS
jgi:RNA polymerase sigma-70 factor (ECF subfamily)